jgi:pSer/pThr/pTyr-binding forkhead associated (FHA) protein
MWVEIRRKLPNKRVVSVGSAPDNDVVIEHPTVSRHHAVVIRRGILRRLTLSDLNSTNGTTVNGRRIARPVALRPNDIVLFGAVSVRLYSESPPGRCG